MNILAAAALLAFGLAAPAVSSEDTGLREQAEYAVRQQIYNPFTEHGIYEDMKIVYSTRGMTTELCAADVVDWVRWWEDGHWDIDDEKIADFITTLQYKYDSYGGEHQFRTTMGELVTIKKGDYGWRIDRSKEIQEISKLLRRNYTTYHPIHFLSKGSDSQDPDEVYGEDYIEVDLSRQVLWMYEDGEVTLISNIVSGLMNTEKQTPGGAYTIKYKQSPAILRGEDYETPVTYWMPFNNGIGLHDATWQWSFGGDACYYRGSHGCINLPLNIAQTIYTKISAGFPVICYYSNPEDE